MVNCGDHAYTVWLMMNSLKDSEESQRMFSMEFHRTANILHFATDEAIRKANKENEGMVQ